MLKTSLVAVAATCMSMAVMANNTIVEMKTSMGNIEIELFNDKAPISAKNFEDYTKAKFYNGTIFHRVIPGFMVQGGGMTADLVEKPTRPAIQNESSNGLSNKRGTLAMARTNLPHSATSQFFINVVDKITKVPTGRAGPHQDVPKQPVKILSVNIKAAAVQK